MQIVAGLEVDQFAALESTTGNGDQGIESQMQDVGSASRMTAEEREFSGRFFNCVG
jgi:hypothetical protein